MVSIPIALEGYLDHSESAVCVVDIQGQTKYSNRTFTETYGQHALLLLLTSAYDRQNLLQCLETVSKNKTPINLSLDVPMTVAFQVVGIAQQASHSASPSDQQNSETLFALTARPKSKDAARLTELQKDDNQRFRDLTAFMNLVPVALARHHVSGELKRMNDGWWKVMNLNKMKDDPNSWAENIHPDDVDSVLAQWTQAITNHQATAITFRMKRGVVILTNVRPNHEDRQLCTEWLGHMTDITGMLHP